MTRFARRRRSRGTAVQESLVFAPVFVGFGAILMWISGVYEARLGLMRDVRTVVATDAMGACAGRFKTIGFSPDDVPAMPEGANLSSITRKLPQAPGIKILSRPSATKVDSFVRVIAGFARHYGLKLEARISLPCNEIVEDGDMPGMKRLSTSSFDPRSL
jgi:hypothetical protein